MSSRFWQVNLGSHWYQSLICPTFLNHADQLVKKNIIFVDKGDLERMDVLASDPEQRGKSSSPDNQTGSDSGAGSMADSPLVSPTLCDSDGKSLSDNSAHSIQDGCTPQTEEMEQVTLDTESSDDEVESTAMDDSLTMDELLALYRKGDDSLGTYTDEVGN